MTDKVLSQDEVDALLKGVASGDIDTEDAKEQIVGGAIEYDFTSQELERVAGITGGLCSAITNCHLPVEQNAG